MGNDGFLRVLLHAFGRFVWFVLTCEENMSVRRFLLDPKKKFFARSVTQNRTTPSRERTHTRSAAPSRP